MKLSNNSLLWFVGYSIVGVLLFQVTLVYGQDSLSFYGRTYSGINSLNSYQYAIEGGISIPSADIGLALGSLTDTTSYCMIRFNMLSSNYNRMLNEYTVGIGRTSSKNIPNIIDMGSTLIYDFKYFQTGVMFGYYSMFGSNISLSETYFNVLVRYGLYNPKGNGLNNLRLKRRK